MTSKLNSALLLGLFSVWLVASPVRAQTEETIAVDLQISDLINNAQVISLASLGIDRRGEGQSLASMLIRNKYNARQNRLYFHLEVRSANHGLLAQLDQEQGYPFHLDPGQVVYATTNRLQDGVPGISEPISFAGGVTQSGKEFINNLNGQTRLPTDVFTFVIAIYGGANMPSGGRLLGSATATIETSPVGESGDLFIQAPGAPLGQKATINTLYPEFSWSGVPGVSYRLTVVRDNGTDTPEALLQGAGSTEPVLRNGAAGDGSLLEYEMLDVLVDRPSFSYPVAGVRKLEPGERYYWQVAMQLQTAAGIEEQFSDIWNFSVGETGDTGQLVGEGLRQQLRQLLGPEQWRQLQENRYRLESIEVNGRSFSGPGMWQELRRFLIRLNKNEIAIDRKGAEQ